jgi:hypothetical protein
MAASLGEFPRVNKILEKKDLLTVTVTPASKPGPVPLVFVDVMLGGKKVPMNLSMFPGLLHVPYERSSAVPGGGAAASGSGSEEREIAYNKLYLKAVVPEDSDHPAAERFAKEFEDFAAFLTILEAKIQDALATITTSIPSLGKSGAPITVAPTVEQSDQYGPSMSAKMRLFDTERRTFGADNIKTVVHDVLRGEDGTVSYPRLAITDIGRGDVMLYLTDGMYVTIDTKTRQASLRWSLAGMFRVARGNKRRLDDDAALNPVESEAVQSALADYV